MTEFSRKPKFMEVESLQHDGKQKVCHFSGL